MAEPFKNVFNLAVIQSMAEHFHLHYADFDQTGFVNKAAENLETLELKARSEQIMQAMITYLPDDFSHAGDIILASLRPVDGGDLFRSTSDEKGLIGWVIMPMSDYVGRCGLAHHALSMTLFKEMTKRFSSEFGIRFLLLADQEKTMQTLQQWITDPDQHVRRLISEGTRPRLPWAVQLPMFIQDPQPVISLLEQLKDDPEEYVRRSVANSLNDIAKDHPDLVTELALAWMKGASVERTKLIRHACRTLLKQSHKKVLRVFGFETPSIENAELLVLTPNVMIGEKVEFSFSLTSTIDKNQALMIDYAIHHQKKNGTTSPKIFKWKQVSLKAKEHVILNKQHSFKIVTTRVYYPGMHKVEIVVNGVSMAEVAFNVEAPIE